MWQMGPYHYWMCSVQSTDWQMCGLNEPEMRQTASDQRRWRVARLGWGFFLSYFLEPWRKTQSHSSSFKQPAKGSNQFRNPKCESGDPQEVYEQLKDTGLALLFKEWCANLWCDGLGKGIVHLHEGSGLGWADEQWVWSMPDLKTGE